MAVSIAPSVEAATAIVDRINAGTVYCLPVIADRTDNLVDVLENVDQLRVDVVAESEETLEETLDVENRTSHLLRVWIRQKLRRADNDELDALKLLVRQIFQQVNNFDSSDRRVRVWQCEIEQKQAPLKTHLQRHGLFVTSLLLRVEVEASA